MLPDPQEIVGLPNLYEQIDALRNECVNFAALLDPSLDLERASGPVIRDHDPSTHVVNDFKHDREYAQEVMFIESHLSSLRGHLEDLENGLSGADAGWQSAVSRLAPRLQACRSQMTRCRSHVASVSSIEAGINEDFRACRELLRGILIKVDLTILIAPV